MLLVPSKQRPRISYLFDGRDACCSASLVLLTYCACPQIGSVQAQHAWATALSWERLPAGCPNPTDGAPAAGLSRGLVAAAAAVTGDARDCSADRLVLAVGGSDGAVRLLGASVAHLAAAAPRQWLEGARPFAYITTYPACAPRY